MSLPLLRIFKEVGRLLEQLDSKARIDMLRALSCLYSPVEVESDSWRRNWRPPFDIRASRLKPYGTEKIFDPNECICERCGLPYWEHPHSPNYLDFDDVPYLHRLCGGQLVKL